MPKRIKPDTKEDVQKSMTPQTKANLQKAYDFINSLKKKKDAK